MATDDTKSYTLRVPFQVQPGRAFGSTGASSRTTFGALGVSLDQAKDGYALRLEGFASTGAASSFLPKVWTGLAVLMVERESAFSESMAPQPVVYPTGVAEPQTFASMSGRPVEAIADADVPSVYETPKNVAFVQGYAPTVTITTPADQALASILQGFQVAGAEQLFHDPRFHTAVDLYATAFFEQSATARLLTLSMAVEVLSPVSYKPEAVLSLMDSWKDSITIAKALHKADDAALASLDALEREMLFRRENSIRSRIRDFVYGELGGDDRAKDFARRALSAYDARSELLHEGRLDPATQAQAINDFVQVLKEVFRRHLQPNT